MDNKEIELQALITEREAMVAENIYRSALSQGPAYADADFGKVAAEIRALKSVDLSATVPAVAAANSQSVKALSEIVWDWLSENAVDVMVDECDVNILIQRLNAGVPALHT